MSLNARLDALSSNVVRPNRHVEWPRVNGESGRRSYPSELFGNNVFGLKELQDCLPKPVYRKFLEQLKGNQVLDKTTADAIAHAARIWAMDRGATHFTHWFQPQTGLTAEKHDAFLTLKTSITDGIEETKAVDTLSGSQLLQAEPDASSFPNGGMRTTFEARGYTIWDTKSPMFIRNGPHGTSVLYIPSVFISYNGDALDEKTILLRSSEALSVAAVRMMKALGDEKTKSVISTLGTEQEYFLVDRSVYNLRPDLKTTGRTLIGMVPPKHQQLEDHYFGQIPSRVLAAMAEVELECLKLGVPIKTRHNEVAPNQFEMAPIFEESSVAVDHNLVLMETLHQVSHRHKLKVLFHEKPFKGVNGSGKHCNWSMSTDSGENLLDPTDKPENNHRFLLVLVAVLDAVFKHGALLRASIASSSNEHRLGANEAPPAIVSAFLGEHLSEILNAIEEDRPVKDFSKPHLTTVTLGGTRLDVKVSTLPEINRDLTDRNRTSPFAFTGNKFEFRAVGSKQSPSFPTCLLNTCVAASLGCVTDDLVKITGGKTPTTPQVYSVVKKYIKSSKAVRFEGNGYSQEWVDEAARRGLPNIRSCPEAFKQLLVPEHAKVLTSQGIMTENEIKSRYHIMNEKYAKDLIIEANTLKTMVFQGILPAILSYRQELSTSLVNQKTLGIDTASSPEMAIFTKLTKLSSSLLEEGNSLVTLIKEINALGDELEEAAMCSSKLVAKLEQVRLMADDVEELVADKFWPYPKYTELLF